MQTLAQIMAAQGRTDPAALNRELRTIERGAEENVGATDAMMANYGFGSSGLNAALQAAGRQGGMEAKAGAIERENQLAEERKRQDLELMKTMLMDPEMQLKQLRLQRRALKDQRKTGMAGVRQQTLGNYTQLVGDLAKAAGSAIGGG